MLAIVLKWLSGGILDRVMQHLEKRKELELGSEKIKSEVTIQAIQQELETRKEPAGIIKAKLSHRVAWLPMTLIEFGAAVYFIAIIVDAIWQLPGDVSTLTPENAALLSVVFAGMFITRK
jgi:hypothetical protein